MENIVQRVYGIMDDAKIISFDLTNLICCMRECIAYDTSDKEKVRVISTLYTCMDKLIAELDATLDKDLTTPQGE